MTDSMTDIPSSGDFFVYNWVRHACLILVAVGFSLLVLGVCPNSWLVVVIAALIGSLLLIVLVDQYLLGKKISFWVSSVSSNRLQFNGEGIEYSAGVFGEQWERPHEEFLIEFRKSRFLLFFNQYQLQLRHKVLGKFRFFCSNDSTATYELFRSLATQYPVKASRSRQKPVDA